MIFTIANSNFETKYFTQGVQSKDTLEEIQKENL